MNRSRLDVPAFDRLIGKREAASHTQQQELVRDSPVVPHAKLWLQPEQAGFVDEAPATNQFKRLAEKSVGSPKVKMGVVHRQFGNREALNKVECRGVIVVSRRTTRRCVAIRPRWVGIYGAELKTLFD